MADVANVARQRVQRRQHLRFRVGRPYHPRPARGAGIGGHPIVTLAEARDKALENARAVGQGSEPRDRLACPYVQAGRYRDKKRLEREAQPERKREQRRKADLDRKRAERAVVKAASNASLPAAPVMPAGLC